MIGKLLPEDLEPALPPGATRGSLAPLRGGWVRAAPKRGRP